MLEENDERLVQYIQLDALKESNTIIWTALGLLLSEIEPDYKTEFLRRLAEKIGELVQDAQRENSATDQHLRLMLRHLIQAVESPPAPSIDET